MEKSCEHLDNHLDKYIIEINNIENALKAGYERVYKLDEYIDIVAKNEVIDFDEELDRILEYNYYEFILFNNEEFHTFDQCIQYLKDIRTQILSDQDPKSMNQDDMDFVFDKLTKQLLYQISFLGKQKRDIDWKSYWYWDDRMKIFRGLISMKIIKRY